MVKIQADFKTEIHPGLACNVLCVDTRKVQQNNVKKLSHPCYGIYTALVLLINVAQVSIHDNAAKYVDQF